MKHLHNHIIVTFTFTISSAIKHNVIIVGWIGSIFETKYVLKYKLVTHKCIRNRKSELQVDCLLGLLVKVLTNHTYVE